MCDHITTIHNKYDNKSYTVSCGHCPACQQEKANRRAAKIIHNSRPSLCCYFVTLTYSNSFIPYLDLDHINSYRPLENDLNAPFVKIPLDVFRDCSARSYRDKFIYKREKTCIGNFDCDLTFNDLLLCNLPCLRKLNTATRQYEYLWNKVGVCYYPDFQLFMKRFRNVLHRNYNYHEHISYFACSEYGGEYKRPHFHALIWTTPDITLEIIRKAVIKAWPYCDKRRLSKNIEIARSAASYVSSYINCGNSLPPLFKEKDVRQKFSHSFRFGFGFKPFNLVSILDTYKKERLPAYHGFRVGQDGVRQPVVVPYPKYVVDRYFPKFKGYSTIDDASLVKLMRSPAVLLERGVIDYAIKENVEFPYDMPYPVRGIHCHNGSDYILSFNERCAVYRNIVNRYEYFRKLGYNKYDFAQICVDFRNSLKSYYYRNMFIDVVDVKDYMYMYDNIKEYYCGVLGSDSLDDVMLQLDDDFEFITDPNDFPDNKARHSRLMDMFMKKDKSKKLASLLQDHL